MGSEVDSGVDSGVEPFVVLVVLVVVVVKFGRTREAIVVSSERKSLTFVMRVSIN